MTPFDELIATLLRRGVRCVVIGVWGANYWARSSATLFTTQDRDLLLPPEAPALLETWTVARELGWRLWAGREPLAEPIDMPLARRVVEARGATSAVHEGDPLEVDLTLTMAGYDFEQVWKDRRAFRVEGIEIPVARLSQIVRSKALADRPKDRLFLASYEEALARLLAEEDES